MRVCDERFRTVEVAQAVLEKQPVGTQRGYFRKKFRKNPNSSNSFFLPITWWCNGYVFVCVVRIEGVVEVTRSVISRQREGLGAIREDVGSRFL